jgi:hypothetical protein
VGDPRGRGIVFFGESAAFVEKTAPNTLGVVSLQLSFHEKRKLREKHILILSSHLTISRK